MKASLRNLKSGEPRNVTWQEHCANAVLMKFYRRFVKPHPLGRQLALWIWTRCIPFVAILYWRLSGRVMVFRLESIRARAKALTPIAVRELVATPPPSIYPPRLAVLCPSPHEAYQFPEIYIAQLRGCVVRGGSNFIFCEQSLLHHELFRPVYDYTSEEIHGGQVIRPSQGKAYAFRSEPDIECLDEVAIFTDALSFNYAHFLTEVLPRLAMFVKHASPELPLVLDGGLHTNIMAAIRMVVGGQRKLIWLDKWQRVRVNVAHVISNCGYVPFERRPGAEDQSGHVQGQFSPVALRAVREAACEHIQGAERSGRYLYIRRNSGYRNAVNAQELEEALVKLGFEVVEPEKLSFAQQVEIFSAAKVVVGTTGAAFANLIFCKPDTKIVIMIAELENTSYYYWQNMACAAGNSVTFVFGEIQSTLGQSIHSDFHVKLSDVMQALAGDLPAASSQDALQ